MLEKKGYVVEQHGRIIEQGRLSPLQAKQFTEATTSAREVARTVVDLNSLAHSASA
jgi:hypothetical protein